MKLLIKEQQESYANAKIYDICKEKHKKKYLKDKKYCKVRDNCIANIHGDIEVLHIAYVI